MPINNTVKLAFSPDRWAKQAIEHYSAGREALQRWLEDGAQDLATYQESAAEIQAATAAAEISQALRAI